MEYRAIKREEILPALDLVWEVFQQDVMGDMTPDGVEQFQAFLQYDHILQLVDSRQLIFFGAFQGRTILGVIGLASDGMIQLFYVRENCQGQGIGRELFHMAVHYCEQFLHVSKMTVRAATGAVQKYECFGMAPTGEIQEQDGRRFVPMEMDISQDKGQARKGHHRTLKILGLVLGSILLLALLFAGGIFLIQHFFQVQENSREEDLLPEGEMLPEEEEDEDEDSYGISAIPSYQAEDLPYELGEDTVDESDDSLQNTTVSFHVVYPTIEGLPGDLDAQINEELKTCATQTMDQIYTNPSVEMMEKVLAQETPVLYSNVEYQIGYANESLLSVLFEDYCFEGSVEDYHVKLRCLNINLEDGTVYELTDLIQLDDAFLTACLSGMRSEANQEDFLSELTTQQLKEALSGDSLEGVYEVNFFVDEEGMEIGFSLNYPADDENDLGISWVTAPFSFSELKPYATANAFWQNLSDSDV